MQKSIVLSRVALAFALSLSACASADGEEQARTEVVGSTARPLRRAPQQGQELQPTLDHEAAFAESQRLRLQRQEDFHAAIVGQLGLEKGEAQRMLALLQASSEAQQRMLAHMRKNRKASREELVATFSQPQLRDGDPNDTSAKIASLLGPDRYAKYQDLRETRREWYVPVR